ncbi:DUF922 domain-containing protein [Hymenobacter sp.]|uniref:DUF922 domain-containing protein n=1 Tax=Hymenobacter sp. TaxID=1898978 RepID=UPI00286B3E9B|nr:DUF922 domain-containing protein [Hymenobacter sp.]
MLSYCLTSFLVVVGLFQGPTPPRPAAQAPTKPAPAPPIIWSAARPLTAADFQGRPGPSDRLAGLTSAEIKAGAACRDFVFTGTVQATFDPATSWLRDPKKASPDLLRHEQLHFDITEIYARLLRQKLVVFQAKANCLKLQPAFNNLTKGVYTEWSREQNRYDAETNHGLNAARQVYWEKQTQVKLAQLEAFALPQ